jgi:hypothetical protein
MSIGVFVDFIHLSIWFFFSSSGNVKYWYRMGQTRTTGYTNGGIKYLGGVLATPFHRLLPPWTLFPDKTNGITSMLNALTIDMERIKFILYNDCNSCETRMQKNTLTSTSLSVACLHLKIAWSYVQQALAYRISSGTYVWYAGDDEILQHKQAYMGSWQGRIDTKDLVL